MSPPSRLLILLAIIIPLGLGTKLYEGPGAGWSHAYGGAICYEVFWILALKACLPRTSILFLSTGVFLVTSGLEFLQLSHHPWLEWIRAFELGRILIGDGFDPWDFAYYAIGCVMAVALHRSLVCRSRATQAASSTQLDQFRM